MEEKLQEIWKWSLMVMCVMCFAVYYAVPNSPKAPTFKFFRFHDQQLTVAMYWHFWALYISRLFFVLTIDAFSKYFYTRTLRWLAFLELVAMVNYFYRYGADFFTFFLRGYELPFDMMFVRILAWVAVAGINIYKLFRTLKYATK